MLKEALAAADAVAEQQTRTNDLLAALARRLRDMPPTFALTVARGSSDHAASYFSYLLMRRLGVPVVSLPMSLVTLHNAPLAVSGQLDSPLARACEWVVPLCAGPEESVAATKSYIAALSIVARLIAHWKRDSRLLEALTTLPNILREAAQLDGSAAVDVLAPASRTMLVGRGLGFAVALEGALKLKETCAIQAEAFSAAELRHGPMALVEEGYPILIFALRGPEQEGLITLARDLRERHARVLLAAPSDIQERDITLATADDEVLDPLLAIQTFYVIAARTAAKRGLNPDVPRHLSKVTRTR
jgi:glucosamine--fructose-6-phosphate aminotransferase (isomerizing)